jgi:WD40 repeat protein
MLTVILLITPTYSDIPICNRINMISSTNNTNSHTSIITAIKVNTNNMFTIGNDQKLKIWNITSGNIQYANTINISYTINTFNKSISYAGLDLSKSNSNIVTMAGSDGTITIYNLTNFYNPTCISFKMGIYANFIALNKINNRIMVTGYNSVYGNGMMIYDYNGTNWNANTMNYNGVIKNPTYGGTLSADEKGFIILSDIGIIIMKLNSNTDLYEIKYLINDIAIRCVISSDTNRIIYFNQNQNGLTIVNY